MFLAVLCLSQPAGPSEPAAVPAALAPFEPAPVPLAQAPPGPAPVPPAPAPPAPDPAPEPEPEPDDLYSEQERELLAAHNQQRRTPLTLDPALTAAARSHAAWMAARGKMSHTADSASGRQPWDRARKAGYTGGYIGENIAYGQQDVAAVMRAWMGSSGHRKNIQSGNYEHCGFGVVAAQNGRLYWCAVFGGGGGYAFMTEDFQTPEERCPPGVAAEEAP